MAPPKYSVSVCTESSGGDTWSPVPRLSETRPAVARRWLGGARTAIKEVCYPVSATDPLEFPTHGNSCAEDAEPRQLDVNGNLKESLTVPSAVRHRHEG